jgi:hypothetical protein
MYKTLLLHFSKLLKKTGLDKKRDDGQRRQISFHSFRSFVKSTISNQGYQDFSEWVLGHRSSISMKYYKVKELERREIYKKCMKYLSFLDYPTVESVGRDFESQLQEKTQEINEMRKDLTRLKRFEIDYNTTFVQRFKEIEENLEYYENLYGRRASKKKSKIK